MDMKLGILITPSQKLVLAPNATFRGNSVSILYEQLNINVT